MTNRPTTAEEVLANAMQACCMRVAAGDGEGLLDAVRALGWDTVQGWQPIATAPTDGTMVWVYTAADHELPAFQSTCAYHPAAGWFTDELRVVTHWRPLPSPPKMVV